MSRAFTSTGTGGLAETNENAPHRRVLVTGAAGNIGSYFAEHSQGKYEMRLMIQESDDRAAIEKYGEIVTGDLLDLEGLKTLCEGVDTVLHLAGSAGPSTVWSELLDNNIIGTYNAMVAAKAAGCRRLIYASSIHAVSGYAPDVQVKTSEPVNPGDLYGVSKCFGEALGRYMAEREGLSVIALRIGAFQPTENAHGEQGLAMMDAFVSKRDLNHLIECCIDVENIQFAILHGLSDNRFKRLDISDARELVGFAPQDDLTQIHEDLKQLDFSENVATHSAIEDGDKSGIREEL